MKNLKYPIILSLIIFGVCLAYSVYFKVQPMVDDAAYDRIAVNIATGKGYAEFPERPLGMDRDIIHIGQSYTVFLAIIFKIFGHHYFIVWLFQALLHALTCLIIFFICLNIFEKGISEKIGLLAMGLYGFWPDLVESTAMLMTETFFLFLAVLIIYLAIKFFKNSTTTKAVWLGLIASVATLTRPTVILFYFIFLVLIFFKKEIKKKYIYLAVLIFIPVIIIGSWMFRNYLKYDRFVISTTGGYDIWIGNNPTANGEMEPNQEVKDYFKNYGFVNIDRKGIEETKKFLLEEPLKFLKLQFVKTSKYFSLIRPSGWWPYLNKIQKSITLILSGLFGAIAFIFGMSGIWHSFKENNYYLRFLSYLTICGIISVIPIVVGTRYRYQIYPLLAIFAAYFLVKLFSQKQKNLYKVFAIVFIFFALNSLCDLIANFDVLIEHLHRII